VIQAASGRSRTSEDGAAPESELAKLCLSRVDFHNVLIAEHVLRADAFAGELASGTPDS